MEDLICWLLGYQSGAAAEMLLHLLSEWDASSFRQDVLSSTSSASEGTPLFPSGDDASEQQQRWCDRLNPVEKGLLRQLFPLGATYQKLSMAVREVSVGRSDGLYTAAIATCTQGILRQYASDVRVVGQSPSHAPHLSHVYRIAFELLEALVCPSSPRAQDEREDSSMVMGGGQVHATAGLPERLLRRFHTFLYHHEVPRPFRQAMGEAVYGSLLYAIAHFVAHGAVLRGHRKQFFVAIQPAPAAEGGSVSSHGGGEALRLMVERLPVCLSKEVAMEVLLAGRERRLLVKAVQRSGVKQQQQSASSSYSLPYLEELAMGAQDETADAVFSSIYTHSLCEGGELAVEELYARVLRVKQLWSAALWEAVSSGPISIPDHVRTLQDFFLQRRGDIWGPLTNRLLPELLEGTVVTSAVASLPSSLFTSSAEAEERKALEDEEVDGGDGGRNSYRQLHSSVFLTELRGGVDENEEGRGRCETASRNSVTASLKKKTAKKEPIITPRMHTFISGVFRSVLLTTTGSSTARGGSSSSERNGLRGFDKVTSHDLHPLHGWEDFSLSITEPQEEGPSHDSIPSKSSSSVGSCAHLVLSRIQAIQLHYHPSTTIHAMISPASTIHYYQALFKHFLSLQCSLLAVQDLQTSFTEAMLRNPRPSVELRKAFQLYHLLHYLLHTLHQYFQVDVIQPAYTETMEALRSSTQCCSVESAQQLHHRYLWRVLQGTFLLQDVAAVGEKEANENRITASSSSSSPLKGACEALYRCAWSFVILLRRHRVSSWAVEPVATHPHHHGSINEEDARRTREGAVYGGEEGDGDEEEAQVFHRPGIGTVLPAPVEVVASLSGIHTQLQQQVISVLVTYLPLCGMSVERGLWVRLDFNRFFSSSLSSSAAAAALAMNEEEGERRKQTTPVEKSTSKRLSRSRAIQLAEHVSSVSKQSHHHRSPPPSSSSSAAGATATSAPIGVGERPTVSSYSPRVERRTHIIGGGATSHQHHADPGSAAAPHRRQSSVRISRQSVGTAASRPTRTSTGQRRSSTRTPPADRSSLSPKPS